MAICLPGISRLEHGYFGNAHVLPPCDMYVAKNFDRVVRHVSSEYDTTQTRIVHVIFVLTSIIGYYSPYLNEGHAISN